MEEAPKKEESSLGDELYGDENTSPNTLAQPSMGVQGAIIKRLIETRDQ